jgi:hypothetical protein
MSKPKAKPKTKAPAELEHNFDEAFNRLIPKKRPEQKIHPISTEGFSKPKRTKWKLVALDEESSHHEFAWEFLRRNRFYQALVDARTNALSETEWGYNWASQVSRTHGLIRLKPYWESYNEGYPPAWQGLDSFAERLPTTVRQEPSQVTLNLEAGQVAIVFDVGGLISGQSAWDIQMWALRTRFDELCKTNFRTTEVKYGIVHKRVLLRRLSLLKKLDEGCTLSTAVKDLDYKIRKPFVSKQLKDAPADAMDQLVKSVTDTPVTTAYEDAIEIYNYIYRHGYLDLLRGSKTYTLDGTRLIPDDIALREPPSDGGHKQDLTKKSTAW